MTIRPSKHRFPNALFITFTGLNSSFTATQPSSPSPSFSFSYLFPATPPAHTCTSLAQAHNGLQGHVKSTHYIVVYDENRLSADTIQQGTHTASYLYARATKAVSLVPAAYYADIACERGREHLNVLMNLHNGSPKARSEVDREETYRTAAKIWGQGVHKDLMDSMFYI